MINIVGVSKSFGEHKVLCDVNMHFEDGKIYCLMGESGIGKTTLLKIIMGLEKPDEGHIELCPDCPRITSNHAGSGTIAAVFQEDRLITDRSPVDNVYLVTKGQARFSSRNEITDALKEILPAECLCKNVSDLSGGMKRRVALARAMLSCGGTVLLDEPFTGLDDEARATAIEFIKRYKNGRTTIVVTHEKNDAALLGADIVTL